MRILVAEPTWNPTDSLTRPLAFLGHEVRQFDYRNIKDILLKRLPILSSPYLVALFRSIWPGLDKALVRTVEEFRPDILLVMKGESIAARTIRYIRRHFGTVCALWFPDDPQFHPFMSALYYRAYDWYFSSSFMTVERIKRSGFKRVSYIPFAAAEELFDPPEITDEDRRRYDCDVNFVGTFYPERLPAVMALRRLHIKIWGKWWRVPLKFIGMPEAYQGRFLPSDGWRKLFRITPLTLNIHLNRMKFGGMKSNQRMFEAAACGAFILTDATIGLEDLFEPDKEVVVYRSSGELREKARYYLDHPEERRRIAERAQERCRREHTYLRRAETILKTLSSV